MRNASFIWGKENSRGILVNLLDFKQIAGFIDKILHAVVTDKKQ